jgi:hypothetical protein
VSNKSTFRFVVVLLFAAFSSAALVLADAAALVQNANSSTTEESPQNANMGANMSAPRRGRGRRGRARKAPAAESTAAPDTQMEVMTSTSGQTAAAPDDDSRGDLSGEKVDLSGTYTGNLSTTGGQDVGSGPATLTINAETFTLTTEGGANHSGRIYSVLTRGEVSAALYFSDMSVGTPPTPLVYNVRARKRGDRLTLWPAPRTAAKLTFGPARGRR